MAKVYIPQGIAREGVDYLREQGYELKFGENPTMETFMEEAADCDAVLLRTIQCPEKVLAAGKKLKIVARHGAGYDNVDVEAAARLGIWVTNTPNALADSVAEFTLGAMLLAAKNIPDCSREMYRGNFGFKNTHKGMDLFGKTLGIIGFGRIGRAVAKKAHFGLDMKILACSRRLRQEDVPEYVTVCPMEELLEKSDVVTLHVSGGEGNRNLISGAEFDRMKPHAVLVNVSRGGVVDEEALDRTLQAGKLSRAVMDVQSKEPPEEDYLLYQNERCILTPHMASNTEECMARMALHAAWQIHKVLSGEIPDWPVNQPDL